jgi:hypothetical protein
MGSVCSSFSTPAPSSGKSSGGGGSVMELPANSATDDLLMDLGIKEKNVQYGRDLADRQARSMAAAEQAMKSQSDDSASTIMTAEPEPEPEPETEAETTTTLDAETDTALTKAEEIAGDTFTVDGDIDADGVTTEEEKIESDDSFTGFVDQDALDAAAALEDEAAKAEALAAVKAEAAEKASAASVGTAAGAAVQQAAAQTTSVGPAEDKAIDLMVKGRKSTILTTPGGLLGSGEEEGKTRQRRSLIG